MSWKPGTDTVFSYSADNKPTGKALPRIEFWPTTQVTFTRYRRYGKNQRINFSNYSNYYSCCFGLLYLLLYYCSYLLMLKDTFEICFNVLLKTGPKLWVWSWKRGSPTHKLLGVLWARGWYHFKGNTTWRENIGWEKVTKKNICDHHNLKVWGEREVYGTLQY